MLLESLKQFDWYNEPANVRFDEQGMHVLAKYRTDFWSCSRYDFKKDDGHFFFNYAENDFCCDLDWMFETAGLFDQCGIMVRIDADNWFKCSMMYEKEDNPLLATSLTLDGYSDLATIPLVQGASHIWYRLRRYKGCYIASYSLDGESYVQLRKFYIPKDKDEVKVGAYICSPQKVDFSALLNSIKLV